MDRRSWLWRRKSTDKSSAEAETSASERFTDEQDTAMNSPKSTQSPEILSKELEEDSDVKVKALSERLSSAVQDIHSKDDLVKQHSKVAEEAVLGWEKAENEIASMKTQLSAAAAKNSALENRLIHLNGALKECVRQLRRANEEQDQTVHDALAKQAREWESDKIELELHVVKLTARLEAKSDRSVASDGSDTADSRLAAVEKENSALKAQLRAKMEELDVRTLETELNRRAAETASKQQLESIKKVAKLEAECRRLQAATRRPSINAELRRTPSSVCAESVTDCQSDCSDSWTSALITELDQFKNDKGNVSSSRSVSLAAVDIDVMDDFLQMEKLASATGPSKGEADDVSTQLVKLEEKAKMLAAEKADREKALYEAQREMRSFRHRAMVAEEKSTELQRQLHLANGEKHAVLAEMEAVEAKRSELNGKLELAHAEIASLLDKECILEERVKSEKTLTLELAAKYQDMEALGAEKKELSARLEESQSEVKKLSVKTKMLERKLEVEKALSVRLATKCHGVEALEAKKKGVELELVSARDEITSLQKKVSSLELKAQEEMASSAELVTRCQDLEARCKQGEELRSQLESASTRIVELNEKVKMLEDTIERNAPQIMELESQLETKRAEISSLQENVCLLEKKLESQKNLSAAYISALGASKDEKNKLASQFQLNSKEVEDLRQKISLLEKHKQKEREQLSEFAAKCRKMEEQLSSTPLGHQSVKPVAIKDLNIRKEKELAKAAGKLADCQKTIALLSSKLKSLADFEEFPSVSGTVDEGTAVDVWDEDLKMVHPGNYSTQIGCLAVT